MTITPMLRWRTHETALKPGTPHNAREPHLSVSHRGLFRDYDPAHVWKRLKYSLRRAQRLGLGDSKSACNSWSLATSSTAVLLSLTISRFGPLDKEVTSLSLPLGRDKQQPPLSWRTL